MINTQSSRPEERVPFALTETEALIRHQLNTLNYWSEKIAPEKLDLKKGDSKAQAKPQNLWQLTEHLNLRKWQEDCRSEWFKSGYRGVVKVVTGAGKTVLALAIIERLQNNIASDLFVAIVVPTVVLQDQWYELLTGPAGLPPTSVGRLGGGHQGELGGDVRFLVSVLNSASAKLPKMASDLLAPLLLVVDECHRAGAKQMSEIFATRRSFNLGLSATPERDAEIAEEETGSDDTDPDDVPETFDQSIVGRELGPIIYELNYHQAIEAEILARFEIQHYGLPLEPEERLRYQKLSRDITDLRRMLQNQPSGRGLDGGALVGWARKVAARGKSAISAQAAQYVSLTTQRKQLVYHARARAEAVLKLVSQAIADNPSARILLFHESIAEVMRLFAMLREAGVGAVAEHSQLSDGLRAESLRLFRRGAAQVLVSARSLIEGFDVPAADVGIVVASSSSVRQRIQTLGRILRKKAGEDRVAALFVLYMAETTDEMIYEKQDWATITGSERNRYFSWDPTLLDGIPIEKSAPPRSPKPREDEIEWDSLQAGSDYPGAYEGAELSCDAQGNVKDTQGRLCSNPQKLPELIHRLRQSYGRFRMTPKKLAILVPTGEGGRLLFGGLLPEPLLFPDSVQEEGSYETIELFVKAKADGYRIARKIRGGEAFALLPGKATDPDMGREALAVAGRVKDLEASTRKQIRRLRQSANGDITANLDGQRVIVYSLVHGLEFPQLT